MIQSTETSDVSRVDTFSKMFKHIGVGVGWVGNYKAFDVRFGSRYCFSLFNKDSFIDLKEIFSLHSWFSRRTSKENDHISIFKHLFWFISMLNLDKSIITDLINGKSQS